MSAEHPIIPLLRGIRDRWEAIVHAMIGTELEGSTMQRLFTVRLNDVDKLIYDFKKAWEKLDPEATHRPENERAGE